MSDGYPSRSELKAIKKFDGTPREFVEYVGSIWRNGSGWKLEEVPASWGDRIDWKATFITGGWSGCEEIIGVVQKTMFSFAFHSMWQRGGLWEYRINPEMIDTKSEWGTQFRAKVREAASTQ